MKRSRITLGALTGLMLTLSVLGVPNAVFAASVPTPSPSITSSTTNSCTPHAMILGTINSSGVTTSVNYSGGFSCTGNDIYYANSLITLQESSNNTSWTTIMDASVGKTFFNIAGYNNNFNWSVSPGKWYRARVINTLEYVINGPFTTLSKNSSSIYALY